MKNSSRALLAVLLLAGFPVLMLVVAGLLIWLEIAAFQHSPFSAERLGIFVVPVLYVLFSALLTFERTRDDDVGVPVTPEEQPELWATVRELASEVGTRAPDEIYLIPQANAAVYEDTHWLGLRVRRRQMLIGAQLLAGTRVSQLRAILGHELGHFSNRHTRFASATYRGRQTIGRVLNGLHRSAWLLRPVFSAYAAMYFRVSMRVNRERELAADIDSSRVAGTAAATTALREAEVLDTAWWLFLNEYASIAWAAGYLPERMTEGYQLLLADGKRTEEFASLRENPPSEPESKYDSHPTTSERIALLEAAPAIPVPPGGERPATDLLRNAMTLLDAVLATGFAEEASSKKKLDWASLIDVGMRNLNQVEALRILRSRSLDDLLDLLDAGRLEDIADPTAPPEAKARAKRELYRPQVHSRLSIVLHTELAKAGAAHWELSWSGPAKLVLAEPYATELDPALDAAIDGDTAPLRALLTPANSGEETPCCD
ncbi:M48 family metallopeptidase [Amycolatopsis sp. GA6-003]|uniref:M48 family metallopeptidase n=1 Tax=Amycolatopsis sp. GA6-003 TaxID=2652444 RepID=UPI0039173FCB